MVDGWHGWVGTFRGVALITMAVLPLAALAVWALARRRSVTGATPAWAWRMSLAEVGIVYGTVPWKENVRKLADVTARTASAIRERIREAEEHGHGNDSHQD